MRNLSMDSVPLVIEVKDPIMEHLANGVVRYSMPEDPICAQLDLRNWNYDNTLPYFPYTFEMNIVPVVSAIGFWLEGHISGIIKGAEQNDDRTTTKTPNPL